MEADSAYSSDVCIILDVVPAGGVECEFDILLVPMGIDASELNTRTLYVYVCMYVSSALHNYNTVVLCVRILCVRSI